jgi:hypothetical protein
MGALSAAGCGGSGAGEMDRPDRIPITGEVIYQGMPVVGATVSFSPQEHSHAAVGLTDSEGHFELQTFEAGDGAVPGLFMVGIRKVELPMVELAADDAEAPVVEERSLIPVKYADPKLSGLTATVKEGGETHFKFELQEGSLTAPTAAGARRSNGGE